MMLLTEILLSSIVVGRKLSLKPVPGFFADQNLSIAISIGFVAIIQFF